MMVRFIPWSSQTKGTFPSPVYIPHNLNHLSAYHVTFDRLSLGLRVYFSPLFLDPVSLLMAYQHIIFDTRGSFRKNVVNFITRNINIVAVVNDNLVSVVVGLHPLKR